MILLASGVRDTVTFAGDVPNGYGNLGTEPARFVLAVFEPKVRPR